MPFSLVNGVDIALMLYLVIWLLAARKRNGAPWRWCAYRRLRWIPSDSGDTRRLEANRPAHPAGLGCQQRTYV
ncbi:hypothetical protein ABQJ54_14120 [Rhodanobacter sp. Si-c]|uniref:Uncharacterized protein n=1 Tax=Rhodanobacter lycopersici TaxID=3162487 RepID=A0ABV3QGJ0_9GAMM